MNAMATGKSDTSQNWRRPAWPAASQQRGHDAVRRKNPGGMIHKRDAGDFWVVEIGDQAHHPAERLADGVESGLVAIRTALPIAGNRTMDESGITLRQFVIIQIQAAACCWTEIF